MEQKHILAGLLVASLQKRGNHFLQHRYNLGLGLKIYSFVMAIRPGGEYQYSSVVMSTVPVEVVAPSAICTFMFC